MRKFQSLIIAFSLMLFLSSVSAQRGNSSAEVKDAMSKLSILNGSWDGSGWMMNQKREKDNSSVTKTLTWKLDNTLLLIEGVGRDDSGNVVHNALATVFYDAREKEYRMHSHLADGSWTDATFEIIEENIKFKWTIDSHGASIMYTISIVDGKWFEEGAYSRAGMDEPMKFFEMILIKK